MCGQTADWNNRRATPSANDEVRERERCDPAASQRESKKTMFFVIVVRLWLAPFFPEGRTPGVARRPFA
jgi:hypothetical protein